jgi:hypothetical protein
MSIAWRYGKDTETMKSRTKAQKRKKTPGIQYALDIFVSLIIFVVSYSVINDCVRENSLARGQMAFAEGERTARLVFYPFIRTAMQHSRIAIYGKQLDPPSASPQRQHHV